MQAYDKLTVPFNVPGIVCPSGEVVLFDPQMHTYVLSINVSFPSDLTRLCLGRGQGPRFTPTMVKKALMSSLKTTSAIAFAELFSCIKRKLRQLGRGHGKLHNHFSISATEL
jgi:hypothetical protein